MKPSSFENAIRLQFDCLARKVIGRTVKNYNKELARRAKHEISFCEIPELELNQLGVSDEYSLEFTSFDVFGTEVRVYDEKLCEAIKKLSERRRNVVLMFYFLELPDAEIAEILDISRNSVYRNRMCSLKVVCKNVFKNCDKAAFTKAFTLKWIELINQYEKNKGRATPAR